MLAVVKYVDMVDEGLGLSIGDIVSDLKLVDDSKVCDVKMYTARCRNKTYWLYGEQLKVLREEEIYG